MRMRNLTAALLLFGMAIAGSRNAHAQPLGPAAVIDAYTAAINAQDVEGALAFVADNAVYMRPIGQFNGREEVRGFIEGLTYDSFSQNLLVFYGVTRCLEIISEASRRIPADVKARHPDLPWADIAGAGNIYRHDYEDVQHQLVWGVVTKRFAALLAFVDTELASVDAKDHGRG